MPWSSAPVTSLTSMISQGFIKLFMGFLATLSQVEPLSVLPYCEEYESRSTLSLSWARNEGKVYLLLLRLLILGRSQIFFALFAFWIIPIKQHLRLDGIMP